MALLTADRTWVRDSACKWNSFRPIPPGRCTLPTAGTRPSGRRSAIFSRRRAIDVEREYYINDAGRQMDILAVSAWLRYLERCGEKFAFPANAYVGEYLAAVGEQLFGRRRHGPSAIRLGGLQRPAAGRAAGRRQGRFHRRADRARARVDWRCCLRDGAAHRARRDCRRYPRGSRGIRRHLRSLVLRALIERKRRHRPLDRGPEESPHTPISKTARSGSRARISATRRTASSFATTGSRLTSPPILPTC